MDFKYSAAWIVIAIATSGLSACAPAYHNSPCGCVPYEYDAPPPLPYTRYTDCRASDAPTPDAQSYLGESASAISGEVVYGSVSP